MDFMNVKDILNKTSRMMSSMTKSETEFKLDFVPVIFANGIDDDVIGLLAALNGERFQYKDKIYNIGERVMFEHATFGLSKNIVIAHTFGSQKLAEALKHYNIVECMTGSRSIHFCYCKYKLVDVIRM